MARQAAIATGQLQSQQNLTQSLQVTQSYGLSWLLSRVENCRTSRRERSPTSRGASPSRCSAWWQRLPCLSWWRYLPWTKCLILSRIQALFTLEMPGTPCHLLQVRFCQSQACLQGMSYSQGHQSRGRINLGAELSFGTSRKL